MAYKNSIIFKTLMSDILLDATVPDSFRIKNKSIFYDIDNSLEGFKKTQKAFSCCRFFV